MYLYLELEEMFISIKSKMLSFEQFKVLINNIIKLYKNGCMMQSVSFIKNSFLTSIENVVPILLTELYGSIISSEIIKYIKDDSDYTLEEIYGLIDDHCRLISKDSAYTLWKLKEIFPHDEMFDYFSKYINDRC